MALAEQACYTLINIPDDEEPPTEQSLKQDFRKGPQTVPLDLVCDFHSFGSFLREGKCKDEDQSSEDDHPANSQWRQAAKSPHARHSVLPANGRPHVEETPAHLFRNCSQNSARWQTAA